MVYCSGFKASNIDSYAQYWFLKTASKNPRKRIGTPEDIAYGALYLASDESSWVNGSELVIDGGETCW